MRQKNHEMKKTPTQYSTFDMSDEQNKIKNDD